MCESGKGKAYSIMLAERFWEPWPTYAVRNGSEALRVDTDSSNVQSAACLRVPRIEAGRCVHFTIPTAKRLVNSTLLVQGHRGKLTQV